VYVVAQPERTTSSGRAAPTTWSRSTTSDVDAAVISGVDVDVQEKR